jgi:hypothetical protein
LLQSLIFVEFPVSLRPATGAAAIRDLQPFMRINGDTRSPN